MLLNRLPGLGDKVLILMIIVSVIVACQPVIKDPEDTQTQVQVSPSFTPTSIDTKLPILPTPTPTSTRSPYLEIESSQLQGASITLMHPWLSGTAKALQGQVDEFNKTNAWGIQVLVESAGGIDDLMVTLNQRLLDEQMPDLAVMYPYQARQLDGDYLWLDLSPYIKDSEWGLSPELEVNINDVYLQSNQLDSTMIGFPASISAPVLFYNSSWAQELGFDAIPMTPESLEEQVCAAAQAVLQDDNLENDGTGGLLIDRSPLAALSWFYAFGGQLSGEDGIPSFNNQAGEESFGFVKSLYDRNCAWIGRQSEPYDYFATRFALVYAGSLEDMILQSEAFTRAEVTDEWIMLPYPSLDGKGTLVVDGMSYIVTVNKPEVQLAAWLFIRWMTSEIQQQVFTQASGTWPVNQMAMENMQTYRQDHPQWGDVFDNQTNFYTLPTYANWVVDKMVLEDAFTRYLALDSSTLSIVLEMLDATIKELSEMGFNE